ncbi:MAG: DUF47 family protein [Clostridia bacterium]|nr:DUF47 family protein [Clostridia bacterium]
MFLSTKRSPFYDLLSRQAELVHAAAEHLLEAIRRFDHDIERREYTQRVREDEHAGDEIERQIIDELNRTFVTPLDREDIYAIASGMEFVLDVIEGVTDRLELYAIDRLIPEIEGQAAGLVRETAALARMIGDLRNLRKTELLKAIQELKVVESEIDRQYRAGVAALFTGGQFPAIEVFKLKEICEALEEASDHCEDVADLVERIVIKHA